MAFERKQTNPLISSRDSKTGDYLVRLDKSVIERVPDPFVFQVGDILHNMRVSLDYLTFSIVKPDPNVWKWVENTQFPIARREETNWDALVGSRLRGVSQEVRSAFQDLQPSNRWDTEHLPHPLFALDALENVHKHRHLLSAEPIVKIMGAAFWVGAVDMTKAQWGVGASPSDENPVVFRLPLNPNDPEPRVQIRAPIIVCFDKKGVGRGAPVVSLLEHISNHIRRNVFPKLEKYV